MSATVLSLI
jgi:hypothetical protein